MFADMKSENGRPAGYGTVRFKNPEDAMKAIGILCRVTFISVVFIRHRVAIYKYASLVV